MGYDFVTSLEQIAIKKGTTIATVNPHSYVCAKRDIEFRRALQSADQLIPDGIGISLAALLLNGERLSRITGMDLFCHILCTLDQVNGRAFFLGATEETLNRIRERIEREFPHVEMHAFSPPFRENFTELENRDMLSRIRRTASDVVFVGMTAPKQEKWIYSNRQDLKETCCCPVGAVFDYYAGTVARPNAFWRHLGLEWLARLVREPRRLWRRTIISGPIFLIDVLRTLVSQMSTVSSATRSRGDHHPRHSRGPKSSRHSESASRNRPSR